MAAWISKENKQPAVIEVLAIGTTFGLAIVGNRLLNWISLFPILVLAIGLATLGIKILETKNLLSRTLTDYAKILGNLFSAAYTTAGLAIIYISTPNLEPLKTFIFGIVILWGYSALFRALLENSHFAKEVSYNGYLTQVKIFAWIRIMFFLSLLSIIPSYVALINTTSIVSMEFLQYVLLLGAAGHVYTRFMSPCIGYITNNRDAINYLEFVYNLLKGPLSFEEIRQIAKVDEKQVHDFLEHGIKIGKIIRVGRKYSLNPKVWPIRLLFGL